MTRQRAFGSLVPEARKRVVFGRRQVGIEDVVAIARGEAEAWLDGNPR
jgi:hypothetical protein